MDWVSTGIGVLFFIWGAGALIVTWFLPKHTESAIFRGVLLPNQIPSTQTARTLASLVPIALGGFFLISGMTLFGPRWPSISALVIFLGVSVAAHLQRSDA